MPKHNVMLKLSTVRSAAVFLLMGLAIPLPASRAQGPANSFRSSCETQYKTGKDLFVSPKLSAVLKTTPGDPCSFDFAAHQINTRRQIISDDKPLQATTPISIESIDVKIAPKHGHLSRENDHSVTYTPDPHWSGTDRFMLDILGSSESKPGRSTVAFDVEVTE
jgi:hypothetical protein